MKITPLQDSFNRGELSPKLFRRSDTEFFLDGVAALNNFVTVPRGAVRRRTGFRYLNRVALPDNTTYVFPTNVSVDITTPDVEVVVT
jgi:hypothetical protein